MIPCKEVAGAQISRKEKKGKLGGGGVMVMRWINLVMEPCNFFHGGCDSIGEGCHLSLEVNEEGVGVPSTNDVFGAVGDVSLV